MPSADFSNFQAKTKEWIFPGFMLALFIGLPQLFGGIEFTNSAINVQLGILNGLVPLVVLIALLQKKSRASTAIGWSFVFAMFGLVLAPIFVLPVCALRWFKAGRTLCLIGLVLLSVAGVFFSLFAEIWMSSCLFHGSELDEVYEKVQIGASEVVLARENIVGATGDYTYIVMQRKPLGPWLRSVNRIYSQYSGSISDLKVIGLHRISFEVIDRDNHGLKHHEADID